MKPFIFGLLFIDATIVCLGLAFGPCFVMQYFMSFLVLLNIWLKTRELVALVLSYPCFHVTVSFLWAMIGLRYLLVILTCFVLVYLIFFFFDNTNIDIQS